MGRQVAFWRLDSKIDSKEDDMSEKTTAQVAKELGSTRKKIIAYLRLHPELKPAKRLYPSNVFLWNDEEIERFRHWPIGKRGQPKKP
jgi:hypothetical protein